MEIEEKKGMKLKRNVKGAVLEVQVNWLQTVYQLPGRVSIVAQGKIGGEQPENDENEL